VYFVAPGLPRIKVVAEVAVHKKCHRPKAQLMPRLVRGLPGARSALHTASTLLRRAVFGWQVCAARFWLTKV
jgi:hypothetical protein